jgi:hypothetical protein
VFSLIVANLIRTLACAWVALCLAAPAAVAASEPVVSTGNATAIAPTSATLNGTVNPEAQATSYYFEYGTTTSYGSHTAPATAGSGSADVDVSAPLAGLTPNTTYHYRLVATNPSGTTLAADVSFTTPKPPTPAVTTGRPKVVTDTSATLTGTVNPRGLATVYFFQYGTTTAYGAETPATSAGAGTAGLSVAAAIGPLAPGTTYHCRLVASNGNGTTHGHDVSFTTGRPPAGISIVASAGAITFGDSPSISGRVLPPRAAHLAVTLQSAPSSGGPWIELATTTASTSGAYSFRPPAPAANTYYRALADGVDSAAALVQVRFRVRLSVSRTHPPAGTVVRFHGHVAPGHRGLLALVQWLGPRGHWNTIRRTRLRGARPGFSFYSVPIRIERSGRYRVVAVADRTHARGYSRVVRVRVR